MWCYYIYYILCENKMINYWSKDVRRKFSSGSHSFFLPLSSCYSLRVFYVRLLTREKKWEDESEFFLHNLRGLWFKKPWLVSEREILRTIMYQIKFSYVLLLFPSFFSSTFLLGVFILPSSTHPLLNQLSCFTFSLLLLQKFFFPFPDSLST